MSLTQRDLGAILQPKFCGASSATAAGTGDNTAVTGATIDFSNFESLVFHLDYTCTMADTKTLSLAVEYQTSADGSSWNTAVPLFAKAVVQTASGSQTLTGQLVGKVDLQKITGPKIRFNFTPDLSASGTDTFAGACGVVMGGKIADTPTSQTYDFTA